MYGKVRCRRRVRRQLGVFAIAAALAGCGSDPFALSSEAVDNHRQRWLAAGVRDYDYDYRRLCECLPSTTRETRVQVRGGQVAAAFYNHSGEVPTTLEAFPTVEDLFDLIDEAMTLNATTLIVSYDAALGYPTEIIIDYDSQVADDEVTIEARNLVAAPDQGVLQNVDRR